MQYVYLSHELQYKSRYNITEIFWIQGYTLDEKNTLALFSCDT
jgi:hypothetical protein